MTQRQQTLNIQFLAGTEFTNSLPELALDPSFIKISVDKSRFFKFNEDATLQKSFQYKSQVEPSHGKGIELIRPGILDHPAYKLKRFKKSTAKDREMLRTDYTASESVKQASKSLFPTESINSNKPERSELVAAATRARARSPWLIRTKYLDDINKTSSNVDTRKEEVLEQSSDSNDQEFDAEDEDLSTEEINDEFNHVKQENIFSSIEGVKRVFSVMPQDAEKEYQLHEVIVASEQLEGTRLVSEGEHVYLTKLQKGKEQIFEASSRFGYQVKHVEDRSRYVMFLQESKDGESKVKAFKIADARVEMVNQVYLDEKQPLYSFEEVEEDESEKESEA
eukprot:snap_masked-scaffold_49-processed-gene-1.62-mRNA-1 protein AED:1.00 eAED:1.00 QI:0/-1/0/0/-1/1/1/0/336